MIWLTDALRIKALIINRPSWAAVLFRHHNHTCTPGSRLVEGYLGQDTSFHVFVNRLLDSICPMLGNSRRPVCRLWNDVVWAEMDMSWWSRELRKRSFCVKSTVCKTIQQILFKFRNVFNRRFKRNGAWALRNCSRMFVLERVYGLLRRWKQKA